MVLSRFVSRCLSFMRLFWEVPSTWEWWRAYYPECCYTSIFGHTDSLVDSVCLAYISRLLVSRCHFEGISQPLISTRLISPVVHGCSPLFFFYNISISRSTGIKILRIIRQLSHWEYSQLRVRCRKSGIEQVLSCPHITQSVDFCTLLYFGKIVCILSEVFGISQSDQMCYCYTGASAHGSGDITTSSSDTGGAAQILVSITSCQHAFFN